MKVEKLVVGVIGLGMGRAHLKGAIAYGAEVGLICDPNPDKLKLASAQGQRILASRFKDEGDDEGLAFEDNYYSILSRTFSIMNHVIARNAAMQHKPDILVKMPFDAYDSIADYARADEISMAGRELMKAALDKYEITASQTNKF